MEPTIFNQESSTRRFKRLSRCFWLLCSGLITCLLCLIGSFPASSLSLSSAATPQLDANNWPQFRGNHQLTGVSPATLPQTLKLLWTYNAGESIESSAAIVNGTVFVGSMSGHLLAVDLQSGKLRWKYQAYKEGIGESSPAVANGVVYIGDLEGVVHAVNAINGQRLWTFKTQSEIKSSPVVVGDRVLIGSYDGHLYCLSARNGALLWRVLTDGYVHATPSVANGIAYIAGCDETFRGIRIADGKELFKISSGAYVGSSPALMGERAYFGTFNNDVLSINLRTRRPVWRYRHPQRHFPFNSSAAVAHGRVVIGGRDKMVHCLNAATGKSYWTFMTRARVESSPAIAGTRVYVGSNDGRFYVLELSSGKKVWEFNAAAPLSASPAIAAGRIVIGDQEGRLYCFG